MLKLGLPSKGRLQEETVAWFAHRGVALERTGRAREYAGRVRGAAGVELVLLSADDMPGELACGRIHLGVTGQDLVREAMPRWQEAVAEAAPLGFGRADLVVAVPSVWIDVAEMSDLDAVAAEFRAAHGQRLRVATKYPHLVRDFFRRHGVADYALVASQGATEGTVRNRSAEAVADITSSGETLRENHLKVLDDGLILRSEATLFLAHRAAWGASERGALAGLFERLAVALPVIGLPTH